MFDVDVEILDGGRAQKTLFVEGKVHMTYGEVIAAWREDLGFTDFFTTQLAETRLRAFQWETPPVTQAGLGRIFEMVQIESPSLALARPDPLAFAVHLRAAEGNGSIVARFSNLGGDAVLVAPVRREPRSLADRRPHRQP